MAANRWRKAATKVNHARDSAQLRRRKISRPEWRSFDYQMVTLLQSIEEKNSEDSTGDNSFDTADSAIDNENELLVKKFKENDRFMIEYLVFCLEVKRGHLSRYIELADEVLQYQSIRSEQKEEDFWKEIFYALYDRAVKLEDSAALREALLAAHNDANDAHSTRMPHKPGVNCPALVEACHKHNLRLVKLFVAKGYFLRSAHFDPKPKRDIWTDMPWRIQREPVEHMDEVDEMNTLRAMSEPCYILSCYTVASEKKRMTSKESGEKVCPCCDSPESLPIFRELMESQIKAHYCPSHKKYVPQRGCSEHVECSDPVFRCFEIEKVASQYAKRVPEYREEFKEIAAGASALAVDLLDNCKDTPEVKCFLEVRTGANTYFSQGAAKTIQYPRLQMAVMNNHKCFVGHMYSQQLLRQQWHGQVDYVARGLRFKLLYWLFQIMLTTWFAIHHMIRTILTDCGVTEKGWKKLKLPGGMFKYLTGPVNLDEPINRFISYTGMYFCFVCLIMTAILRPITDPNQLTNNFHWYHNLLVVFTLSMFLSDMYSVINLRSFGVSSFRLWKMSDLILEVILSTAFLTRLLMGKMYPCSNNECPDGYIEAREPYDRLSNCLFALASVMAIIRATYWFQLHDRLGPLVIYFNRVIFDIFVIASMFLITVLAFASGLVPLAAANIYTDKNPSNATNDTEEYFRRPNSVYYFGQAETYEEMSLEDKTDNYMIIFLDMCYLLFWSILNPEEPEAFDTSTTDGKFAVALVGLYCILSVIILLNLLIAIMNTSISRIEDQKHLYWKFTRTCLWAEFFDRHDALPMPFSIFTFIRDMIKHMVAVGRHLWRKYAKKKQYPDQKIVPTFVTGSRLFEFKESLKEENKLIMKLIERYWSEQKRIKNKQLMAIQNGGMVKSDSRGQLHHSKSEDDFMEQVNISVEERLHEIKKDLKRELYHTKGRVASIEEENEEDVDVGTVKRGGSFC